MLISFAPKIPEKSRCLLMLVIFQIAKMLGVPRVYFLQGNQSSDDGRTPTSGDCAFQTFHFLQSTCLNGYYPSKEDVTGVSASFKVKEDLSEVPRVIFFLGIF